MNTIIIALLGLCVALIAHGSPVGILFSFSKYNFKFILDFESFEMVTQSYRARHTQW